MRVKVKALRPSFSRLKLPWAWSEVVCLLFSEAEITLPILYFNFTLPSFIARAPSIEASPHKCCYHCHIFPPLLVASIPGQWSRFPEDLLRLHRNYQAAHHVREQEFIPFPAGYRAVPDPPGQWTRAPYYETHGNYLHLARYKQDKGIIVGHPMLLGIIVPKIGPFIKGPVHRSTEGEAIFACTHVPLLIISYGEKKAVPE